MLGVHTSISGGYQNVFPEAERLGLETFQIFTKNQRFWKEKKVTPEEGKLFRNAMKKHGISTVLSHCAYLINLGSTDDVIREKSAHALAAEIERCSVLGIKYAVMHPGSSKERTEKEIIKLISLAVKHVMETASGMNVTLLFENTAGQGSSVGWKFEQIGELLLRTGTKNIGMCLDTCHAFAAGYDIRTKDGIEDTFAEIDKTVGLRNLRAFHLNDSKGSLGSRIDRHDHIGNGQLGLEPFRYIMNNFKKYPKVLETKKDNDADIKNLKTLRDLLD